MFGAFHIMLHVFSSTGKLIEGSGGPYAISEAKIVAAGSTNQFLKGKMYNMCKRGHPLLTTAFRGLRMQRFIEDISENDNVVHELEEFAPQGPVDTKNLSKNMKHILTQYEV